MVLEIGVRASDRRLSMEGAYHTALRGREALASRVVGAARRPEASGIRGGDRAGPASALLGGCTRGSCPRDKLAGEHVRARCGLLWIVILYPRGQCCLLWAMISVSPIMN